MRRSRAGLAIAAATVVGAAGCAEDPTRKSGWEGFAPGSFVHLRITTTWSDPAKAPDVVETKHTLVEVTDQGWVTRVETRKADRWIPAEPRRVLRSPPPVHDPGAKLEDLGKEKVTIEGIEYECAKTKSVLAERTSISWTHEKLGVLKWETASDGDDRMWMLVTRLAAKAMVAGKEIECREMRTWTPGQRMVLTVLYAGAVPGGIAGGELTSKIQGATTKHVTEVVAFEAK